MEGLINLIKHYLAQILEKIFHFFWTEKGSEGNGFLEYNTNNYFFFVLLFTDFSND